MNETPRMTLPKADARYETLQTPDNDCLIDRELRKSIPQELLEHPHQMFEKHLVQWFKHGRNLLAEVQPPQAAPGESIVLKCYRSRGTVGAIRMRLRPPRARGAWDKAFALLDRELKTPRPLWLIEPKQKNAPGYLAVETAPPHIRLREVLKQIRKGKQIIRLTSLTPSDEADATTKIYNCQATRFLQVLACFVRRMHDAGVWHRDFSGGNLLIPHTWRDAGQNQTGKNETVINDNSQGEVQKNNTTKENNDLQESKQHNSSQQQSASQESGQDFILIDVNRARLFEPGQIPDQCRIQDLERISLTNEQRATFYQFYCAGDAQLLSLQERYLKSAKCYRAWRDTKNPLLRFWKKLFGYWIRVG